MWGFGLASAFLAVVAIAFLLLTPRTPKPLNVHDRDSLAAYLESVVTSGAAPAVSFAVMRNDAVLWEHSVGAANPFTQRSSNADTTFHWWSVTKVATAITVLDLVEDGLVDLDDEVAALLPFFRVTGWQADSDPITVRHLLNHTSGLRDPIPAMFGWVRYVQSGPSQTAFLQKHFSKFRKLRFQPGTDRRYSNFGYMVLGAVIEHVTGQHFEDVVAARVFGPARMTNSSFVFDEAQDNEALGSHPISHLFTPLLPFYVDLGKLVAGRRGATLWFNRFYIDATPPTGLIATARDVAQLGQVAMHPGIVLEASSLDLMRSADNTPPLGWFETGDGWYQHRGGGPGYAAVLRIYPTDGLSVAVVGNGTALTVETIMDAIVAVEMKQ